MTLDDEIYAIQHEQKKKFRVEHAESDILGKFFLFMIFFLSFYCSQVEAKDVSWRCTACHAWNTCDENYEYTLKCNRCGQQK